MKFVIPYSTLLFMCEVRETKTTYDFMVDDTVRFQKIAVVARVPREEKRAQVDILEGKIHTSL